MKVAFAFAVLSACASALPFDGMSVNCTNKYTKELQLRSVGPDGKYGPSICTMTIGASCVATTDFIAVATDGSWDAGDAFDAWWGDDSYKSAHISLDLKPGKKAGYIEYDKPSLLVGVTGTCNQYDTIKTCVAQPTCIWSHFGCVQKAATEAAPAPNGMSVKCINQYGKPLNLRSVDSTGKYGPAFCHMDINETCTATTDFIAVASDGSWDAGDPFDAWWGDDSWKDADMTLAMRVKPGHAGYVDYVKA
jgi:hypothetical protein